MVELVLPDSSFYITRAREGIDPFVELAGYTDDYEFVTCGMVMLEVCRGRRDPNLLRRFQERFAIMLFIATGNTVWDRARQIAWSLDRQGVVLPAPDLLIAACALTAKAAVLTSDAHFREVPGLTVIERLG